MTIDIMDSFVRSRVAPAIQKLSTVDALFYFQFCVKITHSSVNDYDDKKDKSILLRLLKEEYDYTYTFDTFYDRMKGWTLSCSWGKVEEQKQ